MEVKIVFDNEVMNDKFMAGWGFSCLVDKRILFDTGEKAEYLFNNMANMDIDVSCIEKVVISHDHWDHTGGLWELLKKRKGIKVYACPGFSAKFKDKVKELQGELRQIDKLAEVGKDIFVTGEISGVYKGAYMPEQALVIKTEKGITIITGCSHPGIVKIVTKVKEQFPGEEIYLVFGGFHLMEKDKREIRVIADRLKEMGVQKVGPTHCTGYEAQQIFKEKDGDNFISVKAGVELDI